MRIKELREYAGLQQKELASIIGVSPNTLSQYENLKREPNYDVLIKLADYFNVSIDYIFGRSDIVTCDKCGLSYCPSIFTDRQTHDELHQRWEKSKKKFGTIYGSHSEQEKIKAKYRNIADDNNKSIDERYNAQLEVFRCLFSRSLGASNYNENHVNFATYVSMLLNQPHFKESLTTNLYDKLVNEYGVSAGIPTGTYYETQYIPENVASNYNFSTTEIRHIEKYRDLDNHGKEMVDFTLEKEWERSTLLSENKEHVSKTHNFPQKNNVPELNAAHERTDIKVTDEMHKHDDAIMDDDNF